ncbi:inducible metalloproteinase inhibitor protein [Coccinella septempunctata]|uniref:inducible metalloproteinase inhibitor protein n=1 Tax=Coccinella septempunctata TaxID=41139 RepID=UPI001D06C1E0|nr:inducible metalloproteinase inhibitor protein [Coccinella septempunctata]
MELRIQFQSFILLNISVLCLCLECSRSNEEWMCGSACHESCHNIGQPCPIINAYCNACYCEEGYVRDDSGQCIPVNECPLNE